jgi:hypothetical protein
MDRSMAVLKVDEVTELSHCILRSEIDEYVAVCMQETWSDGQGMKG